MAGLTVPVPLDVAELGVLVLEIDNLKPSLAYPYGISVQKIAVLKQAGFITIGQLAEATDMQLTALPSIGAVMKIRIKNVVGQAIWM